MPGGPALRAWIESDILYLHGDDVPPYQKRGSIVRNNYFWALRSIAAQSNFGKAWEFEAAVWFALGRMLTSFMDSGYLATGETQLEFCQDAVIPAVLQPIATWIDPDLFAAEDDPETEQPFASEGQQPWGEDPAAAGDGPADLALEMSCENAPARGETQRRQWGRRCQQSRQGKPKSPPRDAPENAPRDRPLPPYSSYI